MPSTWPFRKDFIGDSEIAVRISAYRFGCIEIQGRTFRADLIIFADHIDEKWWRKEGHVLQLEDLSEILLAHPEVLIVGTGRYGMMRILPETREHLVSLGIQLIAEKTERACETFNRISQEKHTIAALHLTC